MTIYFLAKKLRNYYQSIIGNMEILNEYYFSTKTIRFWYFYLNNCVHYFKSRYQCTNTNARNTDGTKGHNDSCSVMRNDLARVISRQNDAVSWCLIVAVTASNYRSSLWLQTVTGTVIGLFSPQLFCV